MIDADTTHRVDEIMAGHNRDRSAVIAMLQDIQAEFRYLPEEVLRYLSQSMAMPITKIYSLASFYRAFSLEPRGEHLIHVCLGTACFVKGAAKIQDKLTEHLHVPVGATTEDREFSLEAVRCVGACGLAPVVVVDDVTYGQVDPAKIVEIVESYRSVVHEA